MENPDKGRLLKEYIERLKSTVYWTVKLSGLSRFNITEGHIVEKSWSSSLCSIIFLLVINSCAFFIVYKAAFIDKYLLITETIIVLDFDVFHTCLLLNISLVNRRSCARFLNTGIELDSFLGAKDTEFMRDIADNTYFVLSLIVGFLQITVLVILFFTYLVDVTVYFTGAIDFLLLFFIYYDLSYFLTLYLSLTLRVRYLNVAIMKTANVNLEYLPDQYPFSTFWNTKCDNLVDFHSRAEPIKITQAFRMIFRQLRCLENCYRFTIFLCLTYLTVGTFVIVQTFIIYVKSMNMDTLRCAAITGWCVLSWLFQIGLTQQTDMFYRQIEQTNLICTYIQLKPTYPDKIYELTSSVISTLEVRDARVSIYGLFYFETGLLLRIAASILVYITMQLQFAFPKKNDVSVVNNITATEIVYLSNNIN